MLSAFADGGIYNSSGKTWSSMAKEECIPPPQTLVAVSLPIVFRGTTLRRGFKARSKDDIDTKR